MVIYSITPLEARDVYRRWFAHERKTRPDVFEVQWNHFLQVELPKRAGYPKKWYQCSFDSSSASKFEPNWPTWATWSLPREGTYFRIAERVLSGDPIIPSGDSELIRQIAVTLKAQVDWFTDDPVIIRSASLQGPFKVIEGSHRISAAALLAATDN